MDRIVTSCNNCPFCVTDVDYECIGDDTLMKCNLLDKSGVANYIGSYSTSELFNHESCEYCCSWDELEEEIQKIDFDESRCKCQDIQNKIADEMLSKINFNPDWCPLRELKTLNIIYDKNV